MCGSASFLSSEIVMKQNDYRLKYNLLYSGHQVKLEKFHEMSMLHYEHDIQVIDI